MKLGATITSERGKSIEKTGNSFLNISITDKFGNEKYMVFINDDMSLTLHGNQRMIWFRNPESIGKINTNENLKHDKYCLQCGYVEAQNTENCIKCGNKLNGII